MLYGIFKGCLIEKIPGVRTGITKYTAMTGQNIGFALFNTHRTGYSPGSDRAR